MHFVIISGTARTRSKSNTAKIISVFCEGLHNGGNTSEVWYLSDRKQWKSAKTAFEENENILFALPLYVENVPGIMLEFLASLSAKERPGTRISFLLRISGSIAGAMLRGILKDTAGAAGLWVWRDIYQRRYVRSQSVGEENGSKAVAAIY
ncbi:hypothetical protein IMSAG013_01063 [Clostridiales bacterium]|nr:hypothetical protein IMSAG013_01063 [Clostridiales bacterium]